MTDDLEDVLATVRERVRPSTDERERLDAAVAELTTRAEEALSDLPVDGEVFLVGSAARDTWISGEQDIDLFVRFPPDLDREALEEYGLSVGYAVLPDGREEYAEHPYVTGEHDGFDVDLVPCYDVRSATEIESAVDRTPFHTDYMREHLTETLANEVRVFKQFLTGVGVYGSNLRTRGFSGYLAELLVLAYGSTVETLREIADWHPPVELDPADHGERTFDDPLTVIDPTDPTRNVAAVLSAENLARVQHHARSVLETPTVEAFFPDAPDPLTVSEVADLVRSRETSPLALAFDAPDLVDDELYPQLRKSLRGIGDGLERHGFEVLRSSAFARERAVLFFELSVASRPAVERHLGPPVHVREHAEGFYETYADAEAYGPFVEGDRYVVERERAFTTAEAFVESDAVFDARLGPDVDRKLASGYDVLAGDDVAELAGEFGEELADYFDPSP